MKGIMICPTGIGCNIGGDAGDLLPFVRLIASCCDELITHPNCVNASDINYMPDNTLYVEGSSLDAFLNKECLLKRTKTHNKILVVHNKFPDYDDYSTINSVNAARYTLGIEAEVVALKTPLIMEAQFMEDGKAGGRIEGVDELVEQVKNYNFDALAIHTKVDCSAEMFTHYYKFGGVNPIGGIEAIVSKMIASKIKKPVAHSPSEYEYGDGEWSEFQNVHCDRLVNPKFAVEAISTTYFQCITKGLWRAPKLIYDYDNLKNYGDCIWVDDINFMISPMYCWGTPHNLCKQNGIPIIMVQENQPIVKNYDYNENDVIYASTYLEAAGIITAMKAGVSLNILRSKEYDHDDKKQI